MRGADYKKVRAAGFRIFRLRIDNFNCTSSIWENKNGMAWSLYNRYPSIAEGKRKFNELMKDQKNIGG